MANEQEVKMKKIEVVVAIIRKGDKILAAQRGYGEFEGGWEFPGGKIEKNETKKEALVREIEEELNAKIEIISFEKTIDYDYKTFHLVMHCYWCRLLSKKVELLEHKEIRWLDAKDLQQVEWLPATKDLLEDIRLSLLR